MIVLGLTGSIGMGKSTTAAMIAAHGVPVYDADAVVAALYAPGGAAVAAIRALAPEAAPENRVDREALRKAVFADPSLLGKIEALVHPLARAERDRFLRAHAASPVVLFDIPLLFETGADAECDRVLVVTAPPEVQRRRVLAREGMTQERLDAILGRQMPDAEKRARADYIIDTSLGMEHAREKVRLILTDLQSDADASPA